MTSASSALPAWARVPVPPSTVDLADLTDLCSLLSLAARVVVGSTGIAGRSARTLCSALADAGLDTVRLDELGADQVERWDTVVIVLDPMPLRTGDAAMLRSLAGTGAVLLVLAPSSSVVPPELADLTVALPSSLSKDARPSPWSVRAEFDAVATLAVGAVTSRVIDLLRPAAHAG